jgi:hypothetical protein
MGKFFLNSWDCAQMEFSPPTTIVLLKLLETRGPLGLRSHGDSDGDSALKS